MTAPRNFSNTASAATLAASLSTSAVEVELDSFTGFPSVPFAATIDRNQPTEEIVLVTAVTGSTATLTRGFDGSSVQAHSAGAGFEHTAIAADFRAAGQAVADAAAAASAAGTAQTAANAAQSTADTANTGLGTHTAATAAHGATGAVVGTTNTQVLTNKTVKAPVFQKSDGSALTFIESTEKAAANGVATLGSDGKLAAAQLPAAASGQFVSKPASTSRASTTTLTADPDLFVALSPGLYVMDAFLNAYNTASGTSAPQMSWTVSAGTLTQYGWTTAQHYYGTAGLSFTGPITGAGSLVSGGATASDVVRVGATFRLSAAATLTLTWAQRTSNVTPSVMGVGSWMHLTKIA